MEAKGEYIFVQPASGRYQVPMYIVFFHLCFDQIYHELFKGKVWISFLPFPPSHDTNVSPEEFEYHWSFNPGVNLEQVPVGGNKPSKGVSTDHKRSRVLELLDVSHSRCHLPEGLMLLIMALLIIGCILDVGNKEPG